MSDMIDRISRQDANAEARKGRVSDKSHVIIVALKKALEERIMQYNASHPTDQFSPNAVTTNYEWNSASHDLKITKHTPPKSDVAIHFPQNEGVLSVTLKTIAFAKALKAIIAIDYVGDAPIFYVDGEGCSLDKFADFLLEPALSVTGTLVSGDQPKKYGFV